MKNDKIKYKNIFKKYFQQFLYNPSENMLMYNKAILDFFLKLRAQVILRNIPSWFDEMVYQYFKGILIYLIIFILY